MKTQILILITLFLFSCNSTNTQNKTISEANESSPTVFNNNFFSSVKELSLPVSCNDFIEYFKKVDNEDAFAPYVINTNRLIGKNIYFSESIELSALQNCSPYTPKSEKEITTLIDEKGSDNPESLIIPLFKVTTCNAVVLGYLTYVQGEVDSKFASIELQGYNKNGDLLTEHPITFFYVGGGEGGNVLIKSSISSSCIITMDRTDRSYSKETESGDIEYLDEPLITKETQTFKISESGINEIK